MGVQQNRNYICVWEDVILCLEHCHRPKPVVVFYFVVRS